MLKYFQAIQNPVFIQDLAYAGHGDSNCFTNEPILTQRGDSKTAIKKNF
ncbi:MAG: hypothetical protein LBV77_00895 [Candidatus Adiutrix intracellularis]|nr:hypothetical protein [Candidatus Adiutrix intracellularis]